MQLSRQTLSRLPAGVHVPDFDPTRLKPGIVHLGCGNFHRAHQVAATQAAIEQMGHAGEDWGIVSASMRKPELAQTLTAQDNLYTLLTRAPDSTQASVMAAITQTVFARAEGETLAARIAAPLTRIVTLTVTASGYYLTAEGRLDPRSKAIVTDLKASRPRTAVGILARGLELVRARGGVPPVILCCDNVNENGATLRQAVMDFAALRGDDKLAAWIGQNVQFPDSMVDRIVPTTTENDLQDAERLLGGLDDAAPVSAEPWFRWIISNFDGPRPLWEAYEGTRFVEDVGVFERAKLQMLNGAHMLLAYAGGLAGLDTVAQAASDPALGGLVERFMRDEQTAGIDLTNARLDTYAEDLMTRFRNPTIVHEALRIGRNGSAKMAGRVLRPMRENLEAGRPVGGAHLLIASWIHWFTEHDQGVPDRKLADPRAETLREICARTRGNPQAKAQEFRGMENVFGAPLPDHEAQVAAIAGLLQRFETQGVPAVLEALASA